MDYKNIKRKFNLNDSDVAYFFGYASTNAFRASTANKRIKLGLERFYNHIKEDQANREANKIR